MVSISGSIVNTLGETFTGVVNISRASAGAEIGTASLYARIVVDDGSLALSLPENEGSLDGTVYVVYFDSDSGPSWTEHWLVQTTEAESVTPASLVVWSSRTAPASIPGDLAVGGDLSVVGDVIVDAAGAVLIGHDAETGSWRIVRSGEDLVMQRYESANWVTKSKASA